MKVLKLKRTARILALSATAALMAVSLAAQASASNKWRLQFSGGAHSGGTIVLRITPKGGTPIEASIDVADGTGENAVAKTVVKGVRINRDCE